MKNCFACGHNNPDSAMSCQACNTDLSGNMGGQPTEISSSDDSDFSVDDIIAGRYKVVRILGQGGMGVVYLVRDQALRNREIALKTIHPYLTSHPEACQRFEEEVITCQALTHSNIVRIHDIRRSGALRFFTMEYLKGKTLRRLLVDRKDKIPPFSVQETCIVIRQILDALLYAHQHIIHRDITPNNIMIQGGFPEVTVKLLDFGIARTMSDARFTKTSQKLGTAYYMAPEQLQANENIDHRADLYSVGMVLYEMLTGHMAVGRFRLPGELIGKIPPELDTFVDKSLSPDPDERFPDADTMNQALVLIQKQTAEMSISTEDQVLVQTFDQTGSVTPKPPETIPPREDLPSQISVKKKSGRLHWIILLIALLGVGGWYAYITQFEGPILTIKTLPSDAAVYIDDRHVGSSPIRLDQLSSGSHTVRISKKRYADHEDTFFVQQGAPLHLDIVLLPLPFGDLKITSIPDGAKVLIDGKPKGTTPATLEMLTKGDRIITLEKENYEPWEGQVTIVPLETAEVEARLVGLVGNLKVTTSPTAAEIYLDGKKIGSSPLTVDQVRKGDHEIMAKKTGYDDVVDTVTIQPDTPLKIHLELPSIYGNLDITSTPSGSDIFLDGKKLGQTPLKNVSIKRGKRQLQIKKEGYLSYQQVLTIEKGRSDNVSVDLKPEPSHAKLFVKVAPADARIRILNIIEKFYQGIKLTPGRYHLEVSAAGHATQKTWVTLSTGEEKHVHVELKPFMAVKKNRKMIANRLDMKFLWISPGTFTMGSPADQKARNTDEKPHTVTLTEGFYMQVTEVTVGQFKAFIQATNYRTLAETSGGCYTYSPSGYWDKKKSIRWDKPGFESLDSRNLSRDRPVSCVSYEDAQAFIRWLEKTDGMSYGLPTEAQWEYACRAGTTTIFAFGDCLFDHQANFGRPGFHFANCISKTNKKYNAPIPVGQLEANTWGLFDMHGNVSEWCRDWYGPYPSMHTTDPQGPADGSERIMRGGNWQTVAADCRSARRGRFPQAMASDVLGFRLVLIP